METVIDPELEEKARKLGINASLYRMLGSWRATAVLKSDIERRRKEETKSGDRKQD